MIRKGLTEVATFIEKRCAIEVCIQCLRTLYANDEAKPIELFDELHWICTWPSACEKWQAKNKERHQAEIVWRLRSGRGIHTHLIVVQDIYGHQFGYGNYYVTVDPGQDPHDVAKPYESDPVLVVDDIIPIDNKESDRVE